jgi:hypothetical protein
MPSCWVGCHRFDAGLAPRRPGTAVPCLIILSFPSSSISCARPRSKAAHLQLLPAATSLTMTSWSAAGSATGNGTWSASAKPTAGEAGSGPQVGRPAWLSCLCDQASHMSIQATELNCPPQPGYVATPCRRVKCEVDPPSAGDNVTIICNVVNGQVDIPSCGTLDVPSNADCSKPLVEEILTAWRPFD